VRETIESDEDLRASRAEINARIEPLRAELYRIGYHTGMPTYEAQTERNTRMAELQAQIVRLEASLPVLRTGAAAGSVVIHSVLGDRLVRPPEPEPECEDDPYLRFMRECKQNWL